MTITLYNNKSDINVLNKNLTQIMEVQGRLRESTSIVTPTIMFSYDTENSSYAETFKRINYFYISNFERYYFKTDLEIVRQGLVALSGKSDVLSSFADDVKNSTGIVSKAESSDVYNLYIDDGSLRVYNNPRIQTKLFPSGITGESFILSIAGNA